MSDPKVRSESETDYSLLFSNSDQNFSGEQQRQNAALNACITPTIDIPNWLKYKTSRTPSPSYATLLADDGMQLTYLDHPLFAVALVKPTDIQYAFEILKTLHKNEAGIELIKQSAYYAQLTRLVGMEAELPAIFKPISSDGFFTALGQLAKNIPASADESAIVKSLDKVEKILIAIKGTTLTTNSSVNPISAMPELAKTPIDLRVALVIQKLENILSQFTLFRNLERLFLRSEACLIALKQKKDITLLLEQMSEFEFRVFVDLSYSFDNGEVFDFLTKLESVITPSIATSSAPSVIEESSKPSLAEKIPTSVSPVPDTSASPVIIKTGVEIATVETTNTVELVAAKPIKLPVWSRIRILGIDLSRPLRFLHYSFLYGKRSIFHPQYFNEKAVTAALAAIAPPLAPPSSTESLLTGARAVIVPLEATIETERLDNVTRALNSALENLSKDAEPSRHLAKNPAFSISPEDFSPVHARNYIAKLLTILKEDPVIANRLRESLAKISDADFQKLLEPGNISARESIIKLEEMTYATQSFMITEAGVVLMKLEVEPIFNNLQNLHQNERFLATVRSTGKTKSWYEIIAIIERLNQNKFKNLFGSKKLVTVCTFFAELAKKVSSGEPINVVDLAQNVNDMRGVLETVARGKNIPTTISPTLTVGKSIDAQKIKNLLEALEKDPQFTVFLEGENEKNWKNTLIMLRALSNEKFNKSNPEFVKACELLEEISKGKRVTANVRLALNAGIKALNHDIETAYQHSIATPKAVTEAANSALQHTPASETVAQPETVKPFPVVSTETRAAAALTLPAMDSSNSTPVVTTPKTSPVTTEVKKTGELVRTLDVLKPKLTIGNAVGLKQLGIEAENIELVSNLVANKKLTNPALSKLIEEAIVSKKEPLEMLAELNLSALSADEVSMLAKFINLVREGAINFVRLDTVAKGINIAKPILTPIGTVIRIVGPYLLYAGGTVSLATLPDATRDFIKECQAPHITLWTNGAQGLMVGAQVASGFGLALTSAGLVAVKLGAGVVLGVKVGAAAVTAIYVGSWLLLAGGIIGSVVLPVYDAWSENDRAQGMYDEISRGIMGGGDNVDFNKLIGIAKQSDDDTFVKLFENHIKNHPDLLDIRDFNNNAAKFWHDPRLKPFLKEAVETLLSFYIGTDDISIAFTLAQLSGDEENISKVIHAYRSQSILSQWRERGAYEDWKQVAHLSSFEEIDKVVKEKEEAKAIGIAEEKIKFGNGVKNNQPEAAILNYDLAIKALENINTNQANTLRGSAYLELGIIYSNQRNFERANSEFGVALINLEKVKEANKIATTQIADSLSFRGYAHIELFKNTKDITHLRLAIHDYRKAKGEYENAIKDSRFTEVRETLQNNLLKASDQIELLEAWIKTSAKTVQTASQYPTKQEAKDAAFVDTKDLTLLPYQNIVPPVIDSKPTLDLATEVKPPTSLSVEAKVQKTDPIKAKIQQATLDIQIAKSLRTGKTAQGRSAQTGKEKAENQLKAKELCKGILKNLEDNTTPEAHYLKGRALAYLAILNYERNALNDAINQFKLAYAELNQGTLGGNVPNFELGFVHSGLAHVAIAKYEDKKAIVQYKKAIAQFESAIIDSRYIAQKKEAAGNLAEAYCKIGSDLLKKGETNEASSKFIQALEYAKQTDESDLKAEAHYGIGLTLLAEKQYTKAREEFEKALDLAIAYPNLRSKIQVELDKTKI